ncbi:MAG: hypothetical protein JKX69_10320 [Rhodobacteraceae bacterium]|nr:hypothetical protein [Paracoccaceae bacterium]
MQIVTHIGAHCTDGEKIIKSLLRNSDVLANNGVAVPGHGRYRRLIRETIQSLGGMAPAAGARDVLLDAILDDSETARLVMSNPAFICTPTRVFEGGIFYEPVTAKVQALASLFPDDELEILISLRNPATFIPAVFAQARTRGFLDFMGGLDPREVLWSDVIERIRRAAPSIKLTVWCNEDTPLIWSTLLRRFTRTATDLPLIGDYALLSTIMSTEGMGRFESYLTTHPPQSDLQLRRIIAAFLDKYALADEIEEEVDLPGWDMALIEDLINRYENDILEIAKRDDIDFVAA